MIDKNITKYIVNYLLISLALLANFSSFGQEAEKKQFRNGQLDVVLTPFRLPMISGDIIYRDIDNDGDPDILTGTLDDGTNILWIDDDDDMKDGDREGDLDNDCVMIDINGDGKYGGELDLIIDWSDQNGDGKADIQTIVDNGKKDNKGKWASHYIWFMDEDNDGVFSYIDWDTFKFEGWDHDGRANFFADYNGKSKMIKVHITTWNLTNLEYNWENPFLFFDPDHDGYTEMAIRVVDEPISISDPNDTLKAWEFSRKASLVQMTFDMDNDSEADKELDYDMSLKFMGDGFEYSDQVHLLNNNSGLAAADYLFDDPRWRHLDRLVYPDHETTYDLTFNRGKWDQCWFVFDEDDDCQRWERVEFYEPKDPFKIGTKNGGLDHNPQADPAGDRGEWDTDFSGEGQLYISPLDGRLHLYGAEYGYWRIDQNATYYQGWQGWRGPNLQPEDFDKAEPNVFGTIKYVDTDDNGYLDEVSLDMDGDMVYESVYSLLELGIKDETNLIVTKNYKYADFVSIYHMMSEQLFKNAKNGVVIAESLGLNTAWYANMMNPKTAREKYKMGYWLSYYLFRDMLNYANIKKDKILSHKVQKAYFSTNWKGVFSRE